MSDHPDWTDSSVIASQSQSLFVDAAPVALPTFQTFDTSLFASLDISLATSGTAGDNPTVATVTWFVAGNVVDQDQITFWNTQSVSGINGVLWSLPCKGDSMTLGIIGPAGATTIFRVITGSTRTVPAARLSGFPGISPGPLIGVSAVLIPINTTQHYRLGPVSGKLNMFALTSDNTISVFVTGWYLNKAGVMTNVNYTQGNTTSTSFMTANDVAMPFTAIDILVTNGNVGPAHYLLAAFGQPQ